MSNGVNNTPRPVTPPPVLNLPIGQGVQVPGYNPAQPASRDSYTVQNNMLSQQELDKIFTDNPQAGHETILQDVNRLRAEGEKNKTNFNTNTPSLNNGQYFNLPATFDSETDKLTLTYPNGDQREYSLIEENRAKANVEISKDLEARGIKLANYQIDSLNSHDVPLVLESLGKLDAKSISIAQVKDDGHGLHLPGTRFGFVDSNGNASMHMDRGAGINPTPVQFQLEKDFDEMLLPKGTEANDVFYSRYKPSAVEADLGQGNDVYAFDGVRTQINDKSGQNFAQVKNGKEGSAINFSSDDSTQQTAYSSFAHIMGGTTAYNDSGKTNAGNANTLYVSNTDKKQAIELKGNHANVIVGENVPVYDADDFNMDDKKTVRLSQVTGRHNDESGIERFVFKDEVFRSNTGFFSDSVEKVDPTKIDTAYYNPDSVGQSTSAFSNPLLIVALMSIIGGVATTAIRSDNYLSAGAYGGYNDYGGFA